MVTESTELTFNPMDPSYVQDPYPFLARFRNESPVLRWEMGGGPIFFRHRDCVALLRDNRLGSDPFVAGGGVPDEVKAAFPDYAAQVENSIFYAEGEKHARLRKIVNPVFGPRAVEVHRSKVEEIIDTLLNQLPSEGEINFSAQFSRLYPVKVICRILNVPAELEEHVIAYTDALVATAIPGLPPELFASYMPAFTRGSAFLRECIADRRKQPMDDDLLSDLIAACDEEDRLSDDELLALISALLAGGTDTTYHGTNNTILALLRNPDQLEVLRADPSLARKAFDETLRYDGIQRVPLVRYPKETIEYEGHTLEHGKPAFLMSISALRDPEYLPDADAYDIRRQVPGTTLWFGLGAHFCLGASLARMEAETALQKFLARYSKIELVGEPVYGTNPILRNIEKLPLRVAVA